MRRVVFGLVAISCTTACPRDRTTAPKPVDREMDAAPATPRFTGTLPPFSPALGKSPLVTPAMGGAYAGSYLIEKSELPTMEISIEEGTDGRATLALDDDGTATGCFVSRYSYSRRESHYSSASGKDESTIEKHRTFVGARGRWARGNDGWLDMRFDATVRDACPPPSPLPPENSNGTFALHCVRIEPNEALPAPVLACHTDAAEWPVHDLLVPIALEKPRAWLVLGDAATGIAVHSDQDRRDPEPKITFEKKLVPLIPKQWLDDK